MSAPLRAATAALALPLAACSLSTYDYVACASHADCREAFGFGSVCGEAGLCADAVPEARCERTWPTNLFDRLDEHRDTLVLGALFDLSTDTPEAQAAELAIRQVDDVGGLDGRPYALVTCTYEEDLGYDDLDGTGAAEHGATWLAETLGVPAIVGPATSATAEAAYHVAADAGAVLISPSATSPALSTIDGLTKSDEAPGLFWRTAPPDSLQGEVVASDMLAREVRDVAVLYRTGSYGEGLASVFVGAFETGGGATTLHPFDDDTERSLAVLAAADALPDEVLFISAEPSDIVAFLNAAREYPAFGEMGIFLTDTARDLDVLEGAEAAAALFERIRGTAPWVRTDAPVYNFFKGAYAAAYAPDSATDSVYTAHTWDAAWLAIYGVAWAVENEHGIAGIGLARGLRRVSDGEPTAINPTTWTSIRASFADGLSVDVSGASGELDFDPTTEETTAPVEVWTIADGAFRTEYTIEP